MNSDQKILPVGLSGVSVVNKPSFANAMAEKPYAIVNRCGEVALGKDFVTLDQWISVILEFILETDKDSAAEFFAHREVAGKLFYEMLGASTDASLKTTNEI
jgi:hypothetical protein